MATSWIHTGFWINWNHGPVNGATLTLNQRDAGFLQAFLAILVTFTGSQLWQIAAFIAHHLGAHHSAQKQELGHLQRQVVLRNSTSAGHAIIDLGHLAWAWRSRLGHKASYLIPTAIAIFIIIASTVAGLFTGQITRSTGNAYLIRSNQCGHWVAGTDAQSYAVTSIYAEKSLTDTAAASNYVDNCYTNTTSSPLDCHKFFSRTLPYTDNLNASCPFEDAMCKGGPTAALSLDTGLLDSYEHLGINTQADRRVQYRRRTTCSPLYPSDNFCRKEYAFVEGANTTDTFIRCYFGPTDATNWTISYSLHQYYLGQTGYQLQSQYAYAGIPAITWDPVRELNRTDGDVSVFFIMQNNIAYQYPVDDLLFSAHVPLNISFQPSPGQHVAQELYAHDSWIDMLGCVDQYQICNPTPLNQSSPICTPLTSFTIMSNAVLQEATTPKDSFLAMNEHQFSIAARLIALATSINDVVGPRSGSALKANQLLVGLSGPGLPNNQWHIEVNTWFQAILASAQSAIVQYAAGPSVTNGQVQPPTNAAGQAACDQQLIRAAPGGRSYLNFSVLGLFIVVAVSAAVIILALTIRPVTDFFSVRRHRDDWRKRTWGLEDKLQLHRLAYEGSGWTSKEVWEVQDGGVVPTTHSGVLFPDITSINRQHVGNQLFSSSSPQLYDDGERPTVPRSSSGYELVNRSGRDLKDSAVRYTQVAD